MQYKARAVKHLDCYSRATANVKDAYMLRPNNVILCLIFYRPPSW